MQFHKIEVDEEIWEYLKRHIEDFGDTPNSVLRKLLLTSKPKAKPMTNSLLSKSNEAAKMFPDLPHDIPKALEHTLQMIYLVRRTHYNRTEATHRVAQRHRVDYQTIIDKYCRQLSLKAYEMDRLLESSSLHELESLLIKKYPRHRETIKRFFRDL